MSDTHLNLVPDLDASDAPPSTAAVIGVLSEALRNRNASTCPIRSRGDTASPDEGLTLVQNFLAIADPRVRQAVLHAVATLASTERS